MQKIGAQAIMRVLQHLKETLWFGRAERKYGLSSIKIKDRIDYTELFLYTCASCVVISL